MESWLFKLRISALITLSLSILLSIPGAGESKDLRPSDHGLSYQASPPTSTLNSSSSPMTSFFKPANSSSSSSPPSPAPTDDYWWPPSKEETNKLSALKLAAIVSGGAGVVFMLAAGFAFLYRSRSPDSRLPNPGISIKV